MSKRKIIIPVVVFTAIIIILIIVLNPRYKYNKLIVNESKWNSIKEYRIENTNLVLNDIRFNDNKLIIDEKNNTLYYSLENDSRNKYNPNISYNSENDVKIAILQDEITDEKIRDSYQFKIMIYNEKEYHIYYLKCTNLPLLNFKYNNAEKITQNNIQMEMFLFDSLSNIPNKITISRGKIKMIEDKYMFSLHMLTPGKNRRDNRISILNMKPNSEYLLTPINNETENSRVELFLNNEYKGVYSLKHNMQKKGYYSE